MPYNSIMEFIEATAFTKYVYDYLTEDEYLGLQSFLLQNPEQVRSFVALAESERSAGQLLVKVRAVVYV